MSGSSRISIPPELICCIVEHVHDDVPTLLKCALVSRPWASVARQHLFSSVTVKGHDDRDLSSFLRHLLEFPSICPYVEHITVRNGLCDVLELFSVVSKLTSLRTLAVEDTEIAPLDSIPHPVLLTRGLEYLGVRRSRIFQANNLKHWSPLFNLINMFSSIGTVKLDHLYHTKLSYDAITPVYRHGEPRLPRARGPVDIRGSCKSSESTVGRRCR